MRKAMFTEGNRKASSLKISRKCPLVLLVHVGWGERRILERQESEALGIEEGKL
jgi:hypothetical protein